MKKKKNPFFVCVSSVSVKEMWVFGNSDKDIIIQRLKKERESVCLEKRKRGLKF